MDLTSDPLRTSPASARSKTSYAKKAFRLVAMTASPESAFLATSVEREDGLDVGGVALARPGRVGEGKPPGHEATQPSREAFLGRREVAHAGLEVAPARVDGAESQAVPEHHGARPAGHVHLELLLAARDAGEDAHAVGPEDVHGREDHRRRA